MPVLVQAHVDRQIGQVALQFPYDLQTIQIIKEIPGKRWDKERKCWWISENGFAALKQRIKVIERIASVDMPTGGIPDVFPLKPFQEAGAQFLLSHPGALLTMDMRTGKTLTAISAACTKLGEDPHRILFVIYPSSVSDEWARQIKQWAKADLYCLESFEPLPAKEIDRLRDLPFLIVGCHYEILAQRELDLHAIAARRQYVVIADEIHQCKNRKAGRTKSLHRLAHADGVIDIEEEQSIQSGTCIARWGLTGTPMRNRPRDIWALFEFIGENSIGRYWEFAKRYAAAYEGDHGWVDSGESNAEELAIRLAAISYRVTRAQVATWLPKSDRTIILCDMPEEIAKKYRKLERVLAHEIKDAVNDGGGVEGREALKTLTQATSTAKIPTAIDRAQLHTSMGAKIIIFAHHHETLHQLANGIDAYRVDQARRGDNALQPPFIAGGWLSPAKRGLVIDSWKAAAPGAILLANSLSSGVGIDLSQARVAIFVESEWVPADLMQVEARILDVHQGTRVEPPIFEHLLAKGTIDEAISAALLSKMRVIDQIVGADIEAKDLSSKLHDAKIAGPTKFGLINTDKETVMAAIRAMRDRWCKAATETALSEQDRIATEIEAAFTEDEVETSDDVLF